MHGSVDDRPHSFDAAPSNSLVAAVARALSALNRIIVIVSAIALILACAVLTYSVMTRSIFHSATYWQDEAAVYLIVGATFMTAAAVQSTRGHIGIEAFVGILSPLANKIRLILVDVASLIFCTFFSWKSWTLAHEAWVDGTVSNSTWGPPLSIPYIMMASGMTLLCVQILLQIAMSLGKARS
ncbi:MAG: TRAP transporter small permease [Afipia sp.]|jgi:hypothetical protein|nr:TRAP transporter small permease [Afipia sp.]